MNKVRVIILFLLMSIFTNQYAVAFSFDDDSCTNGQSILARMLSTLTTLGLFAAYSENFYMDGAGIPPDTTKCSADYYPADSSWNGNEGSGSGVVHDSKGCTPCTTSDGTAVQCTGTCSSADATGCTSGATCSSTCNAAGGMKICYQMVSGINPDFSLIYSWSCHWTRSGWSKLYLIPPASLKVTKMGDKLCAQFWTLIGFQSIGCKYLPDCSKFGVNSSCYVAQACSDNSYQQSRSLIGVTGAIIQCIKESITRLFINVSACGDGTSTYSTNYFPSFQLAMRKAIRAAISLYFILFGIKMCLGGEMPSKGEFFTFGAKYILVLYFSVGIFTSYASDGTPIYSDGIMSIVLPLFENGAVELSNIVYSAGGSVGLCAYSPGDYNPGYGYLALWDSLDCRILYYLGLDLSRISNAADSGVVTLASLGAPTILLLIIPAILSFEIIFALFLLIFAVFLLSIVIYFLNIVVLCTIAMAILIYMAPIFVPMALFPPTKGYFDGWLKLLISYSLQPMVVAAYIALVLSIFDQTMFGNCQFLNKSIQWKIGSTTKTIPFFMLCDPDSPSSGCTTTADVNATACKKTIGYQVNPIKSGQNNLTQSVSALFFDITILTPSVVGNMFVGLITLVLFAFLFHKFAELLSDFAAELTGGTAIGQAAGSPMAVFDKVAKLASAAIKYAIGDKKGAAKDAMEATGADKKMKEMAGSGASGEQGKARPGGGGGSGGGGMKPPSIPGK